MSVEIPQTRINRFGLRPVLFSGNQEAPLGGWTLPVPRLGDRFAADIATTQLRQDADGRGLIASLLQATTDDGWMTILQPNRSHHLGSGSPVVDGAGQAGTTLNLRGLLPQALLPRGAFFNVVHGGVRYLHMVAAQAVAGTNGKVAVPIWPMLRFLTVDGEAADIDTPRIEGQLVGFDGKGFGFAANRVEPLEFSIVERG